MIAIVNCLRRSLLSGLTALSLILFFTTLTLWVRSYWREDLFSMQAFRSWQFGSNEGSFRFFRITTYPARIVNPQSNNPQAVHVGPAQSMSNVVQFGHFSTIPHPNVWMVFGFDPLRFTSYAVANSGKPIGIVEKGRGLHFPAWSLAVLAAALPIGRVATFRRNALRRRQARDGKCLNCGYDLRSTPERCPECGTISPKE